MGRNGGVPNGYNALAGGHDHSHATNAGDRLKQFLIRHVPILEWLPKYKAEYLFKDVSGGVTLGLMCLSQTLAQAAIATTLPVSGPYCAFVPPVIYAIMGTSKHASVSSGAMGCILIADVLQKYPDVNDRTELATFIALLVGLFQILMGICNLAFAVRFLSHATISGFVTGGSWLIMTSQLKYICGYESVPHSSSAIFKIWDAMKQYQNINVPTLSLFLFLWAILEYTKCMSKWIKGRVKDEGGSVAWQVVLKVLEMKEILVIIIGSVFAYCTMVDGKALFDIVGDIPTGLPSFKLPLGEPVMNLLQGPPAKLQSFLFSASMIAFTSFLTTFASNKKIALAKGYDMDASQELCALGTASAVGSCFGAFLVCGSLSRTALAAQIGTHSQVTSLVIAAIIGFTLLIFGPLLFYLPRAALSAIVIVSAKGLMDFKTPWEIWHSSPVTFHDSLRKDFVVWCVGFVFTVSCGALVGIGLSVAVNLAQVVAEATAPRAVTLGPVQRLGGQMRDVECHPDAETVPGILIFQFRGPLCFCSAEGFSEELMARVTKETKAVVLSFAVVPYVDYSALSVLKDTLVYFKRQGVPCIIAEVNSNVEQVLKEKLGKVTTLMGESLVEAVLLAQAKLTKQVRCKTEEEIFLSDFRDERQVLHRRLTSQVQFDTADDTP